MLPAVDAIASFLEEFFPALTCANAVPAPRVFSGEVTCGGSMLQQIENLVRYPGPLALAFGFFVGSLVLLYLVVMHVLVS